MGAFRGSARRAAAGRQATRPCLPAAARTDEGRRPPPVLVRAARSGSAATSRRPGRDELIPAPPPFVARRAAWPHAASGPGREAHKAIAAAGRRRRRPRRGSRRRRRRAKDRLARPRREFWRQSVPVSTPIVRKRPWARHPPGQAAWAFRRSGAMRPVKRPAPPVGAGSTALRGPIGSATTGGRAGGDSILTSPAPRRPARTARSGLISTHPRAVSQTAWRSAALRFATRAAAAARAITTLICSNTAATPTADASPG